MNIIAAVTSDWGIGYNGVQSIVIPEDRKYFRKLTDNGVIIVGRKTFEEIGRPLPNRKNIVLTRDKNFIAYGAIVVHSIDEVLARTANDDPGRVFVIGGSSVYNAFLPLSTYAYITKIEAAPPSDAFFPNLDDLPGWSQASREPGIRSPEFRIDTGTGARYSFNLYVNNSVTLTADH